MTEKRRVVIACKVCGGQREIRPSEVGMLVTCSKECSIKYRSINAAGRVVTWGAKISAARTGKPIDTSYITDAYKANQRARAIAGGLGRGNAGRKLTAEHVKKIVAANTGHKRSGWKLSPETCAQMSDRFRGEKSSSWRGGITDKNALERTSARYKAWRKAVFDRDDYACQCCGVRGGELNADHIKPFATHEHLRFELSNGRTLCVPCHKKTDTFAGKTRSPLKALHGIDVRITA